MTLNRLWRLKTNSWAEHKSGVTNTAHVTRSSLASPRLMYMHRFSDVGRLERKSPKISQTREPEPDMRTADLRCGRHRISPSESWKLLVVFTVKPAYLSLSIYHTRSWSCLLTRHRQRIRRSLS